MRPLFLILVLALSACSRDYSKAPNQDRAVAIIWCEVYHASEYAAPPIQWERPDKLTCGWDGGQFNAFYVGQWTEFPQTSTCADGTYWSIPWDFAQVSLPNGWLLSQTALAHELNHARLLYTTGNASSDHSDPSFQPGGLKDQANEALAAAGF